MSCISFWTSAFCFFYLSPCSAGKKYLALLFGLGGGLLYFLVDYGGFYLLLHTRTVEGADPFWFLLWLSMSYGLHQFCLDLAVAGQG